MPDIIGDRILNDKCKLWSRNDLQYGYTEKQYYNACLKEFVNANPNKTTSEYWNWFKDTKRYKYNYFVKVITKLRQERNDGAGALQCDTYYSERKLAQSILTLLSQQDLSNVDTLISVLNRISNNDKAPKQLQKHHLGDCLRAMMEFNQSYEKLGNKKDYETQRTKQIMSSSILSIDNGYKSNNIAFVEKICKISNPHFRTKILEVKGDFVNGNSTRLHCVDKRTRQDFDDEIDEYIHEYWDNRKPNPNTSLSRTVKDRETGQKIKHCHLNIDGCFNKKWNDFLNEYKDELSIHDKIPKEGYFQKMRRLYHPYVYKTKLLDFSNCQKHFNFHSMHKVFLMVLKNVRCHNCDEYKNKLIYFNGNRNNNALKCKCKNCTKCNELHQELNRDTTSDFIKFICCDNGKEFPNENYVKGKCIQNKCGYKYIWKNLSGHAHSFSKLIVIYEQIQRLSVDKNNVGIVEVEQTWSEFIKSYYRMLRKYVKHHINHKWLEIQRKHQRENVGEDQTHIHVDYINNPKVLFKRNVQAGWGNLGKFSFFILNGKWNVKSKQTVTEETTCYFVKDTNHDWNTALLCLDQEIVRLQSEFINDGQRLKDLHFWSDRGEFSCTAFLDGLCKLSCKRKVNIHWHFGEPEHGKNKVRFPSI